MSNPDRDRRPPIPAEIRRRVLVEAGHRCAISTCRHIEVDVHHIVPWSQCRTHEYDNLIAICPNCHRLAHEGKIDRKALRIYKFNVRFAHDKYSQLEIDILFAAYKMPEGESVLWPPYNHVMLKRLYESGFLRIIEGLSLVISGGMRLNPDYLVITEKGRAFIEDLGLHEL